MSKKHKTTFKNMPIGYFSYIEFSMILKETTAMYIRCDTIKLKFSWIQIWWYQTFLVWLPQFSISKLRQPTGQRLSNVRTQQTKISIGPILFLSISRRKYIIIWWYQTFLVWLSQFSIYKLRQSTGQIVSNVRMQEKNSTEPISFSY